MKSNGDPFPTEMVRSRTRFSIAVGPTVHGALPPSGAIRPRATRESQRTIAESGSSLVRCGTHGARPVKSSLPYDTDIHRHTYR